MSGRLTVFGCRKGFDRGEQEAFCRTSMSHELSVMSRGAAVSVSFVAAMILASLLAATAAQSQPAGLNQPGPAVSSPMGKAADQRQYELWRRQIKQALFIPDPLPAIAARKYGSFSPVPGVVAERVTYATLYGMRVPAIVYRPAKAIGHLPGLVVVNGHGGDKTAWYAYYRSEERRVGKEGRS